MDATGHIRTWNEGAQRIKGYNKNEIVGKHFSIFYTDPDKERNHPAHELEQALKHGSYEEEGWRVRKDGSLFWAAITITPMRGKTGFIKVTRDLTERRRYEVELEEARDQALAANRYKSQFVANVTHELRTPLTSLVGLSELLAKDPSLDGELHTCAETMFEASQVLLTMLNDLLDFSKLEAGKIAVEQIPYSIKKTITDTVDLLRPKAKIKSLGLTIKIASDLPSLILGDSLKVRQVLTNLLDNAIKFTESGGIEVTAGLRQKHLFVTVTDTGIGIPTGMQEKLFQPFSQVHEAPAKYGGTGLGLSIADQYVRLMGGEIGVSSEEGSGTTFWFALPVTTAKEVSDDE
jgi:PAS domain S-box-containing protein